MCRLGNDVFAIVPACGEPITAFGLPKCAEFVKLVRRRDGHNGRIGAADLSRFITTSYCRRAYLTLKRGLLWFISLSHSASFPRNSIAFACCS